MPDPLTPEQRRRTMQAVKGRDTSPERRLRRALHARGFRFRLNRRDLPGSPDILLPRWRAAVFVHGCFWHRHAGCPRASTPATRQDYWLPKFERNMERDAAARAALEGLGWRVAILWECGLGARRAEGSADALAEWLRSGAPMLELP